MPRPVVPVRTPAKSKRHKTEPLRPPGRPPHAGRRHARNAKRNSTCVLSREMSLDNYVDEDDGFSVGGTDRSDSRCRNRHMSGRGGGGSGASSASGGSGSGCSPCSDGVGVAFKQRSSGSVSDSDLARSRRTQPGQGLRHGHDLLPGPADAESSVPPLVRRKSEQHGPSYASYGFGSDIDVGERERGTFSSPHLPFRSSSIGQQSPKAGDRISATKELLTQTVAQLAKSSMTSTSARAAAAWETDPADAGDSFRRADGGGGHGAAGGVAEELFSTNLAQHRNNLSNVAGGSCSTETSRARSHAGGGGGAVRRESQSSISTDPTLSHSQQLHQQGDTETSPPPASMLMPPPPTIPLRSSAPRASDAAATAGHPEAPRLGWGRSHSVGGYVFSNANGSTVGLGGPDAVDFGVCEERSGRASSSVSLGAGGVCCSGGGDGGGGGGCNSADVSAASVAVTRRGSVQDDEADYLAEAVLEELTVAEDDEDIEQAMGGSDANAAGGGHRTQVTNALLEEKRMRGIYARS